MTNDKKCKCQFCVMGARISEVLKKRDPENMAEIIRELANLWVSAEFDKEYAEAILDGSWPNAVEILTSSLEKAKSHPNRES